MPCSGASSISDKFHARRDAEFSELSIVLDAQQAQIYNCAAAVWQALRKALEIALPMSG